MKIEVSVTQKHITAGVQCDPARCPIARAVKDAGKFAKVSIGVTGGSAASLVRGECVRFALPSRVVQAIANFDQFGKMEPFGFTVEAD